IQAARQLGLSERSQFLHLNIEDWSDLGGVRRRSDAHLILSQKTHIYAFDFDFPPSVMRHVGQALRNTRTWQRVASCTKKVEWLKLFEEYVRDSFHSITLLRSNSDMHSWWAENVERHDQVRVNLCGSRERLTIYVFRRVRVEVNA